MKKHYCPVEKTEIEFEGQCNWCDEKEWQGLSDDEIQDELQKMWDKGLIPSYSTTLFARAIEAKLMEKNS